MINRNIITGELEIDKKERFDFGKHKGKLIQTVLITDPQYLVWLAEYADMNTISDTWRQYIYEFAEKRSKIRYATYK